MSKPKTPKKPTKKPAVKKDDIMAKVNNIDVVFAIDTTGSMMPWIKEAREQARKAANAITAEGMDLKFWVIEYRDHPPQDTSFVTKTHVCKDSNELQAALDSLHAAGGGDMPEAVWDSIDAACKLDFRDKSDRRLFLIGDSPPHGFSGGFGDHWPQGCPCGLKIDDLAKQILEKKIAFHAISVAGHTTTTAAFQKLADACNAQCEALSAPAAYCVAADTPAHMSAYSTATLCTASNNAGMLRTLNAKYLAAGNEGSATANWSDEKIATELGCEVKTAGELKKYATERGFDEKAK